MNIGKSIDEILFDHPDGPGRVVSLVPSYTESMIDLGFGEQLVGVTDYCQTSEKIAARVSRIGGVIDARVEDVIRLHPDLVLANQEENSRELVHALVDAGLPVWLTFPKNVLEMFDVLSGMVTLYHDEAASLKVRMLETSLDWLVQSSADSKRARYFCPIWQDRLADGSWWWMTFNRQTYAGDLLEMLGGENVFTNRVRRYPLMADLGTEFAEDPGSRDIRYPRVSLTEVVEVQPDVILLPDEPYGYNDESCRELLQILRDTPAVKAGRVFQIDGRAIAWYGTRIGAAMEELPGYFLI